MSTYKEKFADYASDYLLQKRALGDELSDEAHKAIEEIFAERGEQLPPRPSKPIFLAKPSASKAEHMLKLVAVLVLMAASIGVAKQLAHTWVGILISVCFVAYLVIASLRKRTLTPVQREAEENEKKAKEEGLNELMVSAANGNLLRVKELVAFGIDVNTQSLSGTTPLMYAARNNHLPVAQFLLRAGADVRATSKNGSTATAIAKKFGFSELAAYLEQHGAG